MNIPIIFAFITVAFCSDWYRELEDFALSEQLYKISSINDIQLLDIPELWEKNTWTSRGQSMVENTSTNRLWFVVMSNVTCNLYSLVIFLAVCWEIWQLHLFDKFTSIFDLIEWLLLDDEIYQPSSSSNRINLSSSA